MLHYSAFYQGLHRFLRQNLKKLNFEIITCGPLIYTMDHAKFIEPAKQKYFA